MTLELAEKKARRVERSQRHLARFKHALTYMDTTVALNHILGFQATWESVRRVAAEVIAWPVQDVTVAWQIVYFVKALPDGHIRLKAAFDGAIARWEAELVEP